MSGTAIARVHARRVWDSRGRPTVEAGGHGWRAAPSGRASRPPARRAARARRSTCAMAAPASAVSTSTQAVANVQWSDRHGTRGIDACDQFADRRHAHRISMARPTRPGWAATLPVAASLAVAQAAAAARAVSAVALCRRRCRQCRCRCRNPDFRRRRARRAAHSIMQDLMVMPIGATTFGDAIAMVAEIYRAAGSLMAERGQAWPASRTKAGSGPRSPPTKKR